MSPSTPEPMHRDTTGQRGHEPDAVNVRAMALIGLGLLSLVLIAVVGVALAFRSFVPDPPLVTAEKQWQRQNTNPGVVPNQAFDRQRIQANEQALLSRYRWLDKEHRAAQIPIERAIEMMAQRRLQVQWPRSQQAATPVRSDSPAVKEQQ